MTEYELNIISLFALAIGFLFMFLVFGYLAQVLANQNNIKKTSMFMQIFGVRGEESGLANSLFQFFAAICLQSLFIFILYCLNGFDLHNQLPDPPEDVRLGVRIVSVFWAIHVTYRGVVLMAAVRDRDDNPCVSEKTNKRQDDREVEQNDREEFQSEQAVKLDTRQVIQDDRQVLQDTRQDRGY